MSGARIIHFAEDTPIEDTDRGLFVDASALGIEDGSPTPDQIAVNGYSYSFSSAHPAILVYTRDSDGRTLTVNLR